MTPAEAGRLGAAVQNRRQKDEAIRLREEYLKNPILCKRDGCTNLISYNNRLKAKYCSQSCNAKVSNTRRSLKNSIFCRVCWRVTRGADLCQKHLTEHKISNGTCSVGTLRRWLIKQRGHQCESCGYKTWLGQPTLLEIHHIDGNSTNHVLDNVQLLCLNCHGQTSTYRVKNKGNGRRNKSRSTTS